MGIDSGSRPERSSLRVAIARCLERVAFDGAGLDAAIVAFRNDLAEPRDQAFLQEVVYGCLRHWFNLRATLRTLLAKPLRRRDSTLECLLLSGLYQLGIMAVPAHAVVDQSVLATRALDAGWASGLVNAILRKAARGLPPLTPSQPEIQYDHPAWLIDATRAAWPAQWREVLAANNQRPPMTLRVNALRETVAGYQQRLMDCGIEATPVDGAPQALQLTMPVNVALLPGFEHGDASVQDAAAQLAAALLACEPGERILDACAAPGGKTLHLLETLGGEGDVTALDVSAERLRPLGENLRRAQLHAEVITGDASNPTAWWDGRPFSRILLDAPCSGTGVIRRHPDIKLHRTPADITALTTLQHEILSALWRLLMPGGSLLYVTCSILPAENEDRITEFCAAETDCEVMPLDVSWGIATTHGRQILTGERGMDGFFFSLLRKRSDA